MVAMNPFLRIVVTLAVGLQVTLVAARVHSAPPCDAILESKPLVAVKNDRFSATLNNAPLGHVLNEMERATQLKVRIDSTIAAWPISVRLDNSTVATALATLLDGFSYLTSSTTAGLTVNVLSTPPSKSREVGEAPCPYAPTPASAAQLRNPETASHQTSPPETKTGPQSLDEFRALGSNAPDQEASAELVDDYDGIDPIVDQQRQLQSRVARALDILGSGHRDLFSEAINDLIGIDDPQATKTLIDTAAAPPNGISRVAAVQALASHATNLQFSNKDSLAAVARLVDDGDTQIRRIARATLADAQRIEEVNRTQQQGPN